MRNLGRSPTQLAEYRHFRETLTAQGGDFFEQVLTKLEWTQSDINTARASHRDLLTSTEDIALRVNDFPYYIEADIVHLVVWSKLNIPIDETSKSGDMTPAARDRINQWIEQCFVTNMAFGIPRQNITWFKNWAALQSIPKLAHIHLMVRGLPATQLERVLGDKQSLVMLQQ